MIFKTKSNRKISNTKVLFTLLVVTVLLLAGCSKNDDPQKEDVPELITKATLTFTPATGDAVIVTATDPDGVGVKDIAVDGPINLDKSKTYVLTIALLNGLAEPTDEAYDVTKEVETKGDEHQFFFSWTSNVFSDPAGNGNIDNRTDPLKYTGGTTSTDKNGRPLGLTTTWTSTDVAVADASFRVLLKHQPELKSDTSDSNTGETDLDLTFAINIK